jgi:hypothetical protein
MYKIVMQIQKYAHAIIKIGRTESINKPDRILVDL